MRIGDVVVLKSPVRVCFESRKVRGHSTFTSPKGVNIVAVILGEVKQGEAFDAEAVLRKMGWERRTPEKLIPASPVTPE